MRQEECDLLRTDMPLKHSACGMDAVFDAVFSQVSCEKFREVCHVSCQRSKA